MALVEMDFVNSGGGTITSALETFNCPTYTWVDIPMTDGYVRIGTNGNPLVFYTIANGVAVKENKDATYANSCNYNATTHTVRIYQTWQNNYPSEKFTVTLE